MVRPYAEPVLRDNPFLNEIILDDPDGAHAGFSGFVTQVRKIARRRFDTGLILLPKSRLSWMLLFAQVRRRISVSLRLDHLLTCTRWVTRRDYKEDRHEADYCLDLGRKLGVETNDLDVDVFVSPAEQQEARNRLAAAGIGASDTLIGIHPVGRGSAPNWVPERYAGLIDLLLKRRDVRIVLTGSDGDAPVLRRLAEANRSRVHAMPTADLRQSISMISLMRLLVSASTGPMHIAAGLKIPTVSMFCPLTACSPARWGPSGNQSEIVLPGKDYCQHQCPGDPHLCTFEGGITPEAVAQAVQRTLDRAGKSLQG